MIRYDGTDLCTPPHPSFREWLKAIPSHSGTGVECASLTDREILEAFYEAMDGPFWTRDDNWLTDAPLRAWYGVEMDGAGRVRSLRLASNALSGPIPAELGGLTGLTKLDLGGNALTGPMPSQLGRLASLRFLHLQNNALSGPIPPELA